MMHNALIVVLFFLRTDCPISNAYAPEITRVAQKFQSQGVRFAIVFPDRSLTAQQIEQYRRDYTLLLPVEPYAQHAQIRTTPEAAVYVSGRLVYHGRIDNRYITLGKQRPAATEHDLEEVLTAVVHGRTTPFAYRPATGCAIADLP